MFATSSSAGPPQTPPGSCGRWFGLWNALTVWEWALLAVLVTLVLLSPRDFRFDEPVFVANLQLLAEVGPGPALLRNLTEQSPGPLYQYVHAVLRPLTGWAPIAMRLANLGLFLLVGVLLQRAAGDEAGVVTEGRPLGIARGTIREAFASILRAPPSWVVAGLALTEVPAMLFLAASLIVLGVVVRAAEQTPRDLLLAGCAGLLLGVAILGRTQFLMVIPAAGVLALARGMRVATAVYCLAASVLPLWMFRVWGGLVPPDVRAIQSGINPYFGLLALGYLAVITFFVCPPWFRLPRAAYVWAAGLTLGLAAGNQWLGIEGWVPVRPWAERWASAAALSVVSRSTPPILAGVSMLYLLGLVRTVRGSRDRVWSLFLAVAVCLTIATCVKSAAQFSSRYVVQAMPLIYLLAASTPPQSRLVEATLACLGAVLGGLSLYSYYGL